MHAPALPMLAVLVVSAEEKRVDWEAGSCCDVTIDIGKNRGKGGLDLQLRTQYFEKSQVLDLYAGFCYVGRVRRCWTC